MKSKLFLFLLLGFFLISFASSLEIDNIKDVGEISLDKITFDDKEVTSYVKEYPKIEIDNRFGLPLIGDKLFEGYLSQHTETCGAECESTMEIKTYGDSPLIQDVYFETINEDGSRIKQDVRSYQFYIKTNQSAFEVDDYETQCIDGKPSANGTIIQECSQVKIGTHIEYKPEWEKYTIGTVMPKGVYTVKLDAEKKPSRTVDWVIKTNGEWLDEWAVWGAATLSDGLVSYYKLDGDSFVDSLNNHNATNSGTTNTSGKIVDGRNFDGSNDIITSTGNYITGNTSFSHSFWIKPMGASETEVLYAPVPLTANTPTTAFFPTIQSNNKLRIILFNNEYLETTNSLVNNTWTLVTITKSAGAVASTTKIYLNGTEETLTIVGGASSPSYAQQDLTFGVGVGGFGGEYFHGAMDEIAVYNRTLNSTEITEIYNSGAGQTYPFAEASVTLNSPADDSITTSALTTFNATATVTGGAYLTNMSFCSNISGSWICGDTVEYQTGYNFSDYNFTESNGGTILDFGYKIFATSNSKITEICKDSLSGATNIILFDNSKNIIENSTISGNCATFDIDLTENTYYIITAWASGTRNYRHYISGAPSYNITNQNFKVISGAYNIASGSSVYPTNDGFEIASIRIGITTKEQTFNKTIPTGSTLWNVEACDTDGDCGFALTNYTVLLDAVAPTVALNYPTALIDYGRLNGTLQLNFTVTDNNLDDVWYNYNGTNITIAGAVTGVANLSNITLSSKKNVTIYANDTAGNLNETTFSWNYLVFENSQTFNPTTVETSTESFIADITYNSSAFSLINAILTYNGTAYLGTKSGTGNNINFSTLVSVPNVDTDTNFTSYWTIGLVNASGTTYINLSEQTQLVNIINMSLCGSPHTVPYINFTVYDSDTGNKLNASFEATFTYSTTVSSSTNEFSYSDTTGTKSDFDFCMDPSTYDYLLSTNIKLSKTGYSTRYFTWQDLLITNATVEKSLYLLNETGSTSFIVQVIDAGGNKLTGVQVEIERYSTGIGAWVLEQVLTTNYEGKTIATLATENTDYRFKVYEDGISIYNSTSTKIACESLPCTVTLVVPGTIPTGLETLQGLTTDLTYSTAANIFAFSYTDTSTTFSSGTLKVYKFNSGNSSDNELVCSTSSSVSSAVLNCDISSEVNGTYKAIGAIVRTDVGSTDVEILYGIVGDTIYNRIGEDGVLWSFFLFIGIVMIGAFRPALAVLCSVIGIIMLSALNIISIGITATVAIVALAIVLLIQVKNQ